MNSNQLTFRVCIIIGIVFVIFMGTITFASLKSGVNENKRMEICIENGGSYDSSRDNCYLPGVDWRE